MSGEREIRVSDRDRQAAADRLRVAHDEGRLDLTEYDNRLARAYASVTYADLDRLFVDLPPMPDAVVAPQHRSAGQPWSAPQPAVTTQQPARRVPDRHRGLPLALRVLWTIWAFAVAINLTVWLLVSIGNQGLEYFWPIWLAVPGAALVGVTVGVMGIQGGRADRRRRHHG